MKVASISEAQNNLSALIAGLAGARGRIAPEILREPRRRRRPGRRRCKSCSTSATKVGEARVTLDERVAIAMRKEGFAVLPGPQA